MSGSHKAVHDDGQLCCDYVAGLLREDPDLEPEYLLVKLGISLFMFQLRIYAVNYIGFDQALEADVEKLCVSAAAFLSHHPVESPRH